MKLIKDLAFNEGIEYVEGLSSPPISFKPLSMPVLTHWLYPLLVGFPKASAYALAPLQFPGFSKMFTFSRIWQIVHKFPDLANCSQIFGQ